MVFFPNRSRIGGVRFPTNLTPLDDPIMKAWKYEKVAYFMEIPDQEHLLFSKLLNFKRIV